MLFMTSQTTSCTLKKWSWSKKTITCMITYVTIFSHTIVYNNKTMTFIFDSFTIMTILILSERNSLNLMREIFEIYMRMCHWSWREIGWRWILTIIQNLKYFWKITCNDMKYISYRKKLLSKIRTFLGIFYVD